MARHGHQRQMRPYAPTMTESGWGARFLERDDDDVIATTVAAPSLEIAAAASAPLTVQQAKKGKDELKKMRASLIAWLKYRRINDSLATGKTVPMALLKKPGARRSPVAELAHTLPVMRQAHEAQLATQLHQLLSEVFDPQTLPRPDAPGAAVALAQIAIAGKVPGETPAAPAAAGFIWLWPVVIVAGVIAFVITSAIRSSADVAKERERLECIKQGACTDSGFWIKVGAVAFIGWLAWDKFGLRAKLTGRKKK